MQTALEDPLIVLDTIPEAYLRVDRDLQITFLNQAAETLFSRTREELLGTRILDLFSAQTAAAFAEGVCPTLAGSESAEFELYDESQHRWYTINAIPDANRGLVISFADLASRSTSRRPRVNEIPGNLAAFVFQSYVRDDGGWALCNVDRRIAEIVGIDPDPLGTAFKRFSDCIEPKDKDRFFSSIREATLARKDWAFEGRFHRPDGQEKYLRAVARPQQRSGAAILYDGIILDITEQWRAEEELRESETLYRQLFEVESDALLLVDSDSGRILAANAAAGALYGYTREEMVSLNRLDLTAEPEKTLQATTAKQAFIPLRWHRKKDGTAFPVEISGRYFELKERLVFVSAIRDITERRQMQEALEKSEEKFSKAFRGNPAAITIVDLESETYLEVNETFEQVSGYRRDEVIGHRWSDFCVLTDPGFREKAIAELNRKGRLRNWEFHFRRKNGDACTGLLSAEFLQIHGRPCAITATVDITERLRLENELRQAQKLESMGRLAGGVAHDFNNLLTVINGYSEFLTGAISPQDPLHSPALEIKKAGERAAGLTRQLLAFSRKQVIEPRTLDINDVVKDAGCMLQRVIGEDIELISTLDPNLGKVLADPDQIHQVIMNLVVNARDAMPDGGRLEIATKNADVGPKNGTANTEVVPGHYVLLTVTDSGVGISEDIVGSIFDPFFTTRDHGKGTGLGLATVYGIIRQSGGWIEVATKLGRGATFSIYLPRISGATVPVSRPAAAAATSLRGCETVLVVEDQDEVRALTTAVLKAYGYQVLDAANASEALLVSDQQTEPVDLLLTDVILPGMNGRDLADRMRASHPDLKVLFTSGYTADVIARRGVLEPDVAYLPKPFNAESLAAKVREVLS